MFIIALGLPVAFVGSTWLTYLPAITRILRAVIIVASAT
jgi:hypothetical protein